MRRNVDVYRENDNVYLNITFQGNPTITGPVLLEYNATKTTPLVDKASEYYASIVRFDIPLEALPVTICPIEPNQSNSNLTTLKIGINYAGLNYTQPIIFIPQNILAPPPIQNVSNFQVITPYYFVYTFDYMLTLINTALSAAWIASGIPALYMSPPNAPYFIFNSSTQIISLIVPSIFNSIAGSPLASLPTIYINYDMLQYLDNFTFKVGNAMFDNGVIFMISGLVNESNGYTPYGQTATNPPSYYELNQSFPGLGTWTSLRKILITSSTLPIVSEYVPSNVLSPSNSGSPPGIVTQNQSTSINSSMPVISDFVPQINRGEDARSIAYYLPTAQYKLVDMISDMPIYKVDLRVYWEDIYNNIYPLLIPNFQQANVKLAFIRKDLYKYTKSHN